MCAHCGHDHKDVNGMTDIDWCQECEREVRMGVDTFVCVDFDV